MTRSDIFMIAQDFLSREARLLDERRFDEWFEMLHDDLVYLVPIRLARLDYKDEMPEGAYRICDNKNLVRIRIDRLKSGQAWAEVPPSRTLRLVGSLIVEEKAEDLLAVESALLIYRQRGHDAPGEVIPVRRKDELKLSPEGPKLIKRTAIIAEVSLTTPNLGVFL